jgi:penicillin-binding protein 2
VSRLLDDHRHGGEEILSQEQRVTQYRRTYVWLWVIMSVVFIVLIYRFYQLQILKGDFYTDKSEKNFVQHRRMPAIRGIVFDRNRVPLVENRASFDLQLTPAFTKNPKATLHNVAGLMGMDAEELKRSGEMLSKARGLMKFQPIPLIVDLDPDQLARFEFNRMDLDGVEALPVPHRNYKHGTFASHLLGYMNEIDPDTLARLNEAGKKYRQGDYIGRKGVEMAFEDDLRGKDGSEFIFVDAKGRKVDEKDVRTYMPLPVKEDAHPGNNIILSMDINLQKAAEEAFEGREGGVVAIDPRTGFVLAMVSRPAYDPNMMTGRLSRDEWNDLTNDPLKPMMNKVTQDHNHPGSTYKVVGALAALEGHFATTVGCHGVYRLGSRPFRCWKEGGHGSVDIHRAIVQSCDVFFYRMGDVMGIERLAKYARMLGFGQKTGIEIKDETPGVVPDTAFYNRPRFGGYQKGYAINTSIGQGDVNVTLLQLALAYASITNGGRLMQPQTVLRVEAPDGRVVKENKPIVRSVMPVDPASLEVIRSGFEGVVEEAGGTARSKKPPELKDIRMGGKTGTAQVVAVGAKRIKMEDMEFFTRDHAWFVSFAPAENAEIVVAVLIKHGGHGGTAAAPVAFKVLKAYFEKVKGMKLPPGKAVQAVAAPAAEPPEQEDTIPLPGVVEQSGLADEVLPVETEEQVPAPAEPPVPAPAE